MFICENCEKSFENHETKREFFGGKTNNGGYDDVYGCPYCGSSNTCDAVECLECEETVPEAEAYATGNDKYLCHSCFEKLTEDDSLLIEYCDRTSRDCEVGINSYLAGMFSVYEIERILEKELHKMKKYYSVVMDKFNPYKKIKKEWLEEELSCGEEWFVSRLLEIKEINC